MSINTFSRIFIIVFSVFLSLNSFAEKSATPPQNKKPTRDVSKLLPADKASNAEIDTAFQKWSSTWMFDRYIAGSAHATERGFRDGTYVIRGLFDFVRSGTKITIPFAAAYTDAKDHFAFSNLCYNDTSSGMTDCTNPNSSLEDRRVAAMQSRQFLGSIVLVGLVAAMADDNREICVERTTIFGDRYLECN
jgi:hypothetical protein